MFSKEAFAIYKVALYGGSFDPPHKGHRLLADNLAAESGAESVIIMPAYSSPFKNGGNASPADRYEMCRLNFDNPLYKVSDYEIRRHEKNYTIDTLRYISEAYPADVIYLFLGEDMFLSLKQWHCYKDIISRCIPVASSRTDDESVNERLTQYAKNVLELTDDRYIISNCAPFPVSSTEVRQRLYKGESVTGLLNDNVSDYINTRGLYK